MPNLPATMACPTCGNRDADTLTWCGACGGRGYIDRECVDWVPYGSGDVQMHSVEREGCTCAERCRCPKCGDPNKDDDGPCPVCGYEVNWEGPDNFVIGGDEC